MNAVKGFHGEWNMGSPGGWDYQRIAQILGKMAWELIVDNTGIDLDIDFDHPQINAVPGFARMLLNAHERHSGRNPVHAVLLAETQTLKVVLENKNFVDYLNTIDGVKASLAAPEDLGVKKTAVCFQGEPVTVIFMDFNLNTLVDIGKNQDIFPITEAIRQGILVNPRGMEPLGAKGLFEVLTATNRCEVSETTRIHTPWTRQFRHRKTTGIHGEPIADLVEWTQEHWNDLVLKPAHGYSGHGIYVGYAREDPQRYITSALEHGDYIVQELIPLGLWSEETTWPLLEERSLYLKEWQTDFRCFITDEGLQGFLARFGGVPTNVGSGGGIQPIAFLKGRTPVRQAVDKINSTLMKLGYQAYVQILEEVNARAIEMGFTYLLGPIMITLRPRLLIQDHISYLRIYAHNLWQDAVKLEVLWRRGLLDDVVHVDPQEKKIALSQPWQGSPALMVSDGLFSFGVDSM
jgi:hypothetical protein